MVFIITQFYTDMLWACRIICAGKGFPYKSDGGDRQKFKGKAALGSNWPTLPELILGSLAQSRLDASPSQVTPQHFVAGIHL